MSLGNWGESLLTDAFGAFFSTEYLRDYTHASKIFRSNSYQNSPKLKFLFHTYFEINTAAYSTFQSKGLGTINSNTNFGILVKEVKLPSFSFNTTQMNQYNRKRIIQTKIKYDPIDITFHDDNGDSINQLWEAYYTYYYNDGTKPSVPFNGTRGGSTSSGTNTYNNRNTYTDLGINDKLDWGFSGGETQTNGVKVPFFKNITVFGFNQHNFTAYTLINPLITAFSHDTYNYSEGGGTMANRMSLDYETVVYNYGALDGRDPSNIVSGFGEPANYDTRLSPIARPGANGTILGQGGLVDGVGGTLRSLENGDILSAVQNAGTTYNTFKNLNLTTTIGTELNTMLINSLQNTPNTRNTFFDFLSAGSTPGIFGTANSPVIGARTSPQNISDHELAGHQVIGLPQDPPTLA